MAVQMQGGRVGHSYLRGVLGAPTQVEFGLVALVRPDLVGNLRRGRAHTPPISVQALRRGVRTRGSRGAFAWVARLHASVDRLARRDRRLVRSLDCHRVFLGVAEAARGRVVLGNE